MHNTDADSSMTRLLPLDDKTILRPSTASKQNKSTSSNKFDRDYSLHGTVGVGGVGRVLLGVDEKIGREVAIKEMLGQSAHLDGSLCDRFLREARITGRLEHPGVVPVYDFGIQGNGAPYYVMRLIRGDTLAEKLKECNDALNAELALANRLILLDRLIDICETLAYAHSKGVIHRDIKPSNVVLGAFGETIVLDWGLAKVENEDEQPDQAQLNTGENADLTLVGDIIGTPAYMAPEQANPRFGDIDACSDVFAIGCILYYLLAGHSPLRGKVDEILSLLTSDQPMPTSRNPKLSLPPELTAICDKALNKDKSKRFANAGELADELRAYRDGRLISTYAYSPGDLLRRFVIKNKIPLMAIAAVLVAILIGAGLAFKFGVEAEKARKLAVIEQQNVQYEKQKVERALADVTRISNDNLTTADHALKVIKLQTDELQLGMEQLAATMRGVKKGKALTRSLENLLSRFPNVESFAASSAPGKIIAVAPSKYQPAIGSDTSKLEHNILVMKQRAPITSRVYTAPEGFDAITLVVPVKDGHRVSGMLSARIMAATFFGDLLSNDLNIRKRDIWVVQDNGLILYDNNPNEIGQNLFREERFQQIAELRQLAKQIILQDAGVGYYENQSADQTAGTQRVASWRTLRLTENREWTIVVLEVW
jgi:serine/threonine-protein kinase